jgi:hypothetical protein
MKPVVSPERHLLLSIHDVGPRFDAVVDRLAAQVPEDKTALHTSHRAAHHTDLV